MKFHLMQMRPAGTGFYVQAFHEVIETLAYALAALGHSVTFKRNVFMPGAQNIVLGPQFAHPSTPFPKDTILYNLEQLGSGNPIHVISPELTQHFRIWDYSPINMPIWRERKVDARLVPIGYVPQLTRIKPAPSPDIDVLFYGATSERRAKVLKDLIDPHDLKIHYVLGFGEGRDAVIARSKLILNMHYYEAPQLFEQVRVSYLLSNSKCVVCEESDDFPPALNGAVSVVPYDKLAETCRDLIKDSKQRYIYEKRGFELFSRIREVDLLREALK